MKVLLTFLVLSGGLYAQTPTPRASLSDQRLCADQAQKKGFNEYLQSLPEKDRRDSIITSLNHFDPKLTVCYVALHNFFNDGDATGEMMDVSDAFEGTLHASFAGRMNAKYEAEVTICDVDDEKCHSAQEFRELVRKKFGISL